MAVGQPYKKQPWEVETIKIDWSSRISSIARSGYTISAVSATVFNSAGDDVTSQILVGSANYSGTDIYVTLSGGITGGTYNLRVRVTSVKGGYDDQKQEEDVTVVVKEGV